MVGPRQKYLYNFIFFLFATFAGLNANGTDSSCASLLQVTKSSTSLNPKLVDYILNLNDNANISQQIYDDFSVDDIARAIVLRIAKLELEHSEVFANKMGNIPFDLKKDSEIILFFGNKDFDSILEKGFLNQHQTGTSRGHYDPSIRSRIEDLVAGLNLGLSEDALRLRPKSAFLNIPVDIDLHEKISSPLNYGNIGAVMKSSVYDRATWTSGDSVNVYYRLGDSKEDIQTGLTVRGTFDRKSLPNFSNDYHYYEAQIFGKIDFNDISHFLVADEDKISQLIQLKKPIYQAKEIRRNKRVVFMKGQLLYAGENNQPSGIINKTTSIQTDR
jgi:hypothetical protein